MIEKKHYETVFPWLHKKHVNEWFHGQGLQNTLSKILKHHEVHLVYQAHNTVNKD